MIGQKTLFSSNSDEWETPQDFFDKLNKEFKFNFDLAATKDNRKCNDFTSDIFNTTFIDWFNCHKDLMFWCNPPYSKCKEFVKFVSDSDIRGVMLLPSRTDTRWFHDFVYKRSNVEIRFVKGRLKFSGAKYNAPFPSMLAIWR